LSLEQLKRSAENYQPRDLRRSGEGSWHDLGAKIAMGGCRCGRRLGIETAR
jgi:hypothetical protein